MKCPVCKDQDLAMADREGIEIDYCPTCRGVWLDRGELDKIIERSASDRAPRAASKEVDSTRHYDSHGSRTKKKKGILGELFDF